MARYKVVKDIYFGSGINYDSNGNSYAMNDFAPKVGDVIELGELTTQYYRTIVTGYLFKSYLIPEDAVMLVSDSTPLKNSAKLKDIPGTNDNNSSKSATIFTTKNIVIAIVVLVLTIAIIKKYSTGK